MQRLHVAFPSSSLSLFLYGVRLNIRIDCNTSEVIVTFPLQASTMDAIRLLYPFIRNPIEFTDIHLSLFVSSPFVHEYGNFERILYCNRFPISSADSPILKDIDDIWHYFYKAQLGDSTPSSHIVSVQKPSVILFVTDNSRNLIQTIDTSLVGLSLSFTESAKAAFIGTIEKSENNKDKITYSNLQRTMPTPHQSIPKTPVASNLFRIEPIDDICQLQGAKYCGQVFNSFILFCSRSMLYIVDQHAAHERINLDYYLDLLVNDRDAILEDTPVNLQCILSPAHLQTVKNTKSLLSFWKYSFTVVDSSTVQITNVPSIDGYSTSKNDFIEYIDSLSFESVIPSQYHLYSPPSIRRLLAQRVLACKNAVRFNTPLSDKECIQLVNSLFQCVLPLQCAHGRPTVCRINL